MGRPKGRKFGWHNGKAWITELEAGEGNDYLKIDDKGDIKLFGDARVVKNVSVPADLVKSPSATSPSFIKHGVNGAWSFEDGKDQRVSFSIRVPDSLDFSEDFKLKMAWSSEATEKDAVWNVTYNVVEVGEDTTGSGTTISNTATSSSTANGLNITSFDLPSGSISEDDIYIAFEIEREGSSSDDTLSDSAELSGLNIEFTANTIGGVSI